MNFPSLTPELEAIMQAEIAKNPTLQAAIAENEELLKKHAQNVAGLRYLLEEIMRVNRNKKAARLAKKK